MEGEEFTKITFTRNSNLWGAIYSINIYVNGKKIIDYFKKPNLQIAIYRPLALIKRENEFDVYNCGMAGNGFLVEYATIVEYATKIKPDNVFWIYSMVISKFALYVP